jgi:hypothetical protein
VEEKRYVLSYWLMQLHALAAKSNRCGFFSLDMRLGCVPENQKNKNETESAGLWVPYPDRAFTFYFLARLSTAEAGN